MQKIICVSIFTKKKLLNVMPFGAEPVVIHHGIEPKNINLIQSSASSLEKLTKINNQIDQDKTILVYVSRLESMKEQKKMILYYQNK